MAAVELTAPRRLVGRRALITGAAGGQGRAVAHRFAAEGARLVLTDADAGGLEQLAGELRAADVQVETIVADLRDSAAVDALVPAAVDALGGLDVLYSNAGVYLPQLDRPVTEMTDDAWDMVMNINLESAFRICRAAVSHLAASGRGSLITVSSVAGYAGDDRTIAYPSSKSALIGMTKSIAYAYGGRGLRANVICPGLIDTPMTAQRIADPELAPAIMASIPLGRPGRSEEVAAVAAFLASDDASYVSGIVLPVHGGMRR
jgi:3-oxoacyl-[acyl-carrier protein] reductase